MSSLDQRAVTTRYVVLTALRWLPTGLLVPILALGALGLLGLLVSLLRRL